MAAFAIAGNALGDNWEDLQSKLHYVDYLVAAADRGMDRLPGAAPKEQRRVREAGARHAFLMAEALPLRHALVLGAVQGPTELLPVSSSGHLIVVPRLLGWPYTELDPELRKSFEVAVHAGTALALLVGLRREVADYLRSFGSSNAAALGLSFLPAALVALKFERTIERRLSEPLPVAIGLIAGAIGMLAADGRPQQRRREDATLLDAVVIGTAQARRWRRACRATAPP